MKWTTSQICRIALSLLLIGALCAAVYLAARWGSLGWYYAAGQRPAVYAGSTSCRQCHEKFYTLWSTSNHGQSMLRFTPDFARNRLTPQPQEISVGGCRYVAQWDEKGGWVAERKDNVETKYAIQYAIGGKNVFYFLTDLEGGKLQVLPLAYDVRRKEWYDMAASGDRHFAGATNETVHWKEWPYTFNTACYNCHVSQLATNYDVGSDTYRTAWAEPGINCETCHGPSSEHNRLFAAAPGGWIPKDQKIKTISRKRGWSAQQVNDSCAICHAKLSPVTNSFQPGDRYFDHYDLVTLESPDFYPDGRDLGENYSLTSWQMSPCAKSGQLDCLYCHTSSGRYRFKGELANQACMPCHRQNVENAAAHTHHPAGKPSSPTCVACHMPMTEFARMKRSDHSMRPPMPAATLAFGSPNACNQCHTGKDAAWADANVRQWRTRDYQAPTLHIGGLIVAARKQDWSRLGEMLDYLKLKDRDEVFANSLVRLLRTCPDQSVATAMAGLLGSDPSPLVRASAAANLGDRLSPQTISPLAAACRDSYRLVRVRAGAELAAVPDEAIPTERRQAVQLAVAEYLESLRSRPDDGFSHYNLGNYYADHAELDKALACYDVAHRLRPDSVLPLVNASLVLNRLGQNEQAQARLRQAAVIEPRNAVVQLNLGMLLGEMGRPGEAEQAFRAAAAGDPKSAQAAYNLGLLLAKDRAEEAIGWLQKACDLCPTQPRYAYALAFHLNAGGQAQKAAGALQAVVKSGAASGQVYALLGEIYLKLGQPSDARETYRQAVLAPSLTDKERSDFVARLQAIPK